MTYHSHTSMQQDCKYHGHVQKNGMYLDLDQGMHPKFGVAWRRQEAARPGT